jgi:signal transduction histidine kinase
MESSIQPTILFVDDVRENLVLLEHIIRPLDLEIISANSGIDALEKTAGKEIFLALVDVKMPGMDGIELAGYLQNDKSRSMIPIIFITAYADDKTLERCYEVNAVDFISKPFQRKVLLSKVKIFLELERQKNLLRENQLQLHETALELDRINQSLKHSHEELSELTAHLEEVRENERKRIALDLHDDLGQRLTALLMDLAWVKNKLAKDKPELLEKLSTMKSQLDETINTVRKISLGLRPSTLDDLGLVPALKWHFKEVEDNTGLIIVPSVEPDELELDPRLSILIFRVVQEALTNVTRHAKASKVVVNLKQVNASIYLSIIDDGVGITKDKIAKPQSFGLLGIKERVTSWGGKLFIEGEPGKGTRLRIELPLNTHKV